MHPDHVGGAEAAAEATGAPVLQGRLDYAQCERVWGTDDWPERIAELVHAQRRAAELAQEMIDSGHVFADFVRFVWNPTLVDAGRRDRRLARARHARPRRRPPLPPPRRRADRRRLDPHADHAGGRSLSREQRPIRSATTSARSPTSPSSTRASRYGGHGATVDDAGRARTRDRRPPRRPARPDGGRARRASRAAATRSRTRCSDASCRRSSAASPSPRRSSHLERLVVLGRAARAEDDRTVTYTAAQPGGRPTA